METAERPGAPGQSRALKLLRRVIEQRRASGEDRLPGVRDLAQQAGVAYVTMVKALARLKARGVLVARPRRGLTVVGPFPDLGTPEVRGLRPRQRSMEKWEEVLSELRRDILGGVFPQNEAVSAKELGRRYDTCYPTLRKALLPLLEKRIASHARKGYRFQISRNRHPGSDIILLARSDKSGHLDYPSVRSQWQVRSLESVCSAAGVRLLPLGVDSAGAIRDRGSTVDLPSLKTRDCLGFIVWTTALREAQLGPLLGRLAEMRKPLVILDETGQAPSVLRPRAGVRMLSMSMAASESAGRVVGQYLLQLGHRNVAFLSLGSPETDVGSGTRMRGLRNAFAEAGLPGGVHSFSISMYTDLNAIEDRAIRTSVRMVGLAWGQSRRRASAGAVSLPAGGTSDAMLQFVRSETMQRHLVRMLQDATRDPAVTALVCFNDWLALECLNCLKSSGVAQVPEAVSLLGFDDSLEAFSHGLTSLNFNAAAYMRASVGFILDPTNDLYRTTSGQPMEFDGVVVARKTTGRARTA
jgi:DNA-binding LacI/PurR family transcriptional regulator/DNA-binding FadR family transcriptional regulator